MTEPARFGARLRTQSAAATYALGQRLGRLLRGGDVVALVGDLGAGKTQLIRGACRGARVPHQEVASPTFAIVASYHGRVPIHHADLYRIGDEDELYATGFFDLVGREGALLVEWADRVPGALPEERLEIRMAHDPRAPSVRHIEVIGVGGRHAELAQALASSRKAGRGQVRGRRRLRTPVPAPRGARRGKRRSPEATK